VEELNFSNHEDTSTIYNSVSDSNRTFAYYPEGTVDDTASHTNFLNTSTVSTTAGSSLAMIAGGEGVGSSSVSSTAKIFTIASQHQGPASSESTIQVKWQINTFILASASAYDCEY
jgi:hypothetical protein